MAQDLPPQWTAPATIPEPLAPPPAYDSYGLKYGKNWTEEASLKLTEVLETMRISEAFSDRLKYVQGEKLVFVLDDSGSMNSPSDDVYEDEYGKFVPGSMSRFDEEREFVKKAFAVYGGLAGQIDVYFLNRGAVKNPDGTWQAAFCKSSSHPRGVFDPKLPLPRIIGVKTFAEIEKVFTVPPSTTDLTPLSTTLEQVKQDNRSIDCRLIINIVTDGTPGPHRFNGDSMERFTKVLRSTASNTFINIRLCVDDDDDKDGVVAAYNKHDKTIPRLDVNDDYLNESAEVLLKKGIKMTRGEYLLKTTIGAADKTPGADNFDAWDETILGSVPTRSNQPPPSQCCVVL